MYIVTQSVSLHRVRRFENHQILTVKTPLARRRCGDSAPVTMYVTHTTTLAVVMQNHRCMPTLPKIEALFQVRSGKAGVPQNPEEHYSSRYAPPVLFQCVAQM